MKFNVCLIRKVREHVILNIEAGSEKLAKALALRMAAESPHGMDWQLGDGPSKVKAAWVQEEGVKVDNGVRWELAVPVISTSHISKETAAYLTKLKLGSPEELVAVYDRGFFLFVGDDYESDRHDLQLIGDWAAKHKYDWVRLDSDGEKIDVLPIHKWE